MISLIIVKAPNPKRKACNTGTAPKCPSPVIVPYKTPIGIPGTVYVHLLTSEIQVPFKLWLGLESRVCTA